MTIAERKAREAYDRKHPWRSIVDAGPSDIGMICEARFSIHGIPTEIGRSRYMTDGTHWYQIDPPSKCPRWALPMEFRSTGIHLSERRMRSVIARSDWTKPRPARKRYDLFWRADETRTA